MILGDTKTEDLPATTLDDVFRRAAARRPDAIALADPPDRDSFTDGPPRHLTYAEADRVVSAIASRLRTLGLQTDAIVGIQLPNTVESVLTILGVLRAGMIAVPLPLLWRRADVARALGQARRQSHRHHVPHWRFRRLRDGDAGRGRRLSDQPCLQLRPQSAGRRDCAGRPAAWRPRVAAGDRARRQPSGSRRSGDVRRHA